MPDADDDWSDESLLATGGEYPGVGVDDGLPEIARFRAGVSRLAAKCLSLQAEGEERGLSVFLLQAAGPPASFVEQAARVRMLDRGLDPLDKRVWFVSHVVAAGSWLPADYPDDDALFGFVIDDLEAGAVPAIVFDAREPDPELRFYPNGLAEDEIVEPVRIAMQPISLDVIFGCINAVHSNQLVTPKSQPRGFSLWRSAAEGVASSSAEDTIAGLVSAGLHTALENCRVWVEQPMPTGRLDIEIEERMMDRPGGVTKHAVLELKVLRGRNPNKTRVAPNRTKKLVEDGVGQAAAYRDDKGALAAALCCFDMRDDFNGRECFAHVLDIAEDMDVELEVWPIFRSAAAYRAHQRSTGALSKLKAAHSA